jgi:hypothetical protein
MRIRWNTACKSKKPCRFAFWFENVRVKKFKKLNFLSSCASTSRSICTIFNKHFSLARPQSIESLETMQVTRTSLFMLEHFLWFYLILRCLQSAGVFLCNRTIQNSFSPAWPEKWTHWTDSLPDFVLIHPNRKSLNLWFLLLFFCRSLRVVKTCLWVSGNWCVSPALYSGRQRSQSRSTHSTKKWKLGILWFVFRWYVDIILLEWAGRVSCPQWGRRLEGWGPTRRPAWLAEGEWPSRVWFYHFVPDGRSMPPALTDHTTCPDLLLNVHKTPPWATSRKEGMAWYSSRPMAFSGCPHIPTNEIPRKHSTSAFSRFLLFSIHSC